MPTVGVVDSQALKVPAVQPGYDAKKMLLGARAILPGTPMVGCWR